MAIASDSLGSGLRLVRFASATDFSQHAETFLVRHEAENNLLLGIVSQLIRHPEVKTLRPSPYLSVVESNAGVLAVAIMTLTDRVALSYLEQPSAMGLLARDIYQAEPEAATVVGPAPAGQLFAEQWHAITGRAATMEASQRIYQLSRVRWPVAPPGAARPAEPGDIDLMARWLDEFSIEAHGKPGHQPLAVAEQYFAVTTRGMYFWVDGSQRVSMAGYAGPTPNGIRVGPVYTPPEFRGRGYASALVARLSQDLLDGGRRYCFLFTDLANATANRIYQAIGYVPVSDVDVVRLR
jgi:uncharacterized protein